MFHLTAEQYQNNPMLLLSIAIIAFTMGASIGSFLNVVIYRVPLGLSVNEPRRSFCPQCKYQIPWHLNLPLISWLALRGKCANCKTEISSRYIFVEFITGMIFLLAFLKFGIPLAIPFWVMLSLFIATIYIDIDHFIIPNEITLGGLVAGVILSGIFPEMHLYNEFIEDKGRLMSSVWSVGYSLLGAATGYALLWTVVQLGKLAFGRKTQEFAKPVAFKIHEVTYDTGECEPVLFYESDEITEVDVPAEPGATAAAHAEAIDADSATPAWEQQPWSDMFSRPSDKLIMTCERVCIDDHTHTDVQLTLFETRLEVRDAAGSDESSSVELEAIQKIDGTCSKVVIPREAMGWGDVKFLAMAGAFLGWGSVFFTLVAASLLGSILALSMGLFGRRDLAARLPFGPYLVFGATLWLFYGRELVAWYWKLARMSE